MRKNNVKKRLFAWCGIFFLVGSWINVTQAQIGSDMRTKTVTIGFADEPLEQALFALGSASGFQLTLPSESVEGAKPVNLPRAERTVEATLNLLLQGTNLAFQVQGNRIVFFVKDTATTTTSSASSPSMQQQVTGKVIDDVTGETIPFATVIVKGTSTVTVTTDQGTFSITVPSAESILQFSFMGYETLEIPASMGREMTVRMKTTVSALEGVVITGYQTISKERTTGSAVTLSTATLSNRYTPDISSNLEGKIAGLVNYGGKITIRGTSTLFAESKPLLVIDGLPIEADLDDINQYDIESITVLKDASTAAIYGARASNGVIVIVTKKASERNRVEVDVFANTTIYQKRNVDYANNFYLTPAQQVDLESNFYEWFFNRASTAASNRTSTQQLIAGTRASEDRYSETVSPIKYAYWQLAMNQIDQGELNRRLEQYRKQDFARDFAAHALLNRILQQYNVSIRNRTENFQSNLVFNMKNDNTGIIHANDNQLNFFYKASYDMTKWMTINFGLNSILHRINESNSEYATNPFNVPAYYNLLDENGDYASHIPLGIPYNDYCTFADDHPAALRPMHFNHVQELAYDRQKTNRQNNRFQGELLFKIIPGLTINTMFIYEASRYERLAYSEAESFIMRYLRNIYTVSNGSSGFTYMIGTGGKLVNRNISGDAWTGRTQLSFSRTINQIHAVDFIAGLEFRETRTKGRQNIMLGWDDQLQSHSTTTISYPDLSRFSTTYFIPGYYAQYDEYPTYIRNVIQPVTEAWHRNASGYANIAYTCKKRYNAFASIRKDYADLFGVETKLRGSPFWSAGLSWNISREDFMSTYSNILNDLKLRISYGYTGNIYQGATSYMTATINSPNRFTQLSMATVASAGNPELSWERAGTFNFGIDFSLLNYRVRGAVDWYNKKSDKVFSTKTLDITTGFPSLEMNMADVKNNGLELALAYDWVRPNRRDGFGWTTSGTASWNKNEVTYVEVQVANAWQFINLGHKQGYPVHSLFSYVFAGLNERGDQTWLGADGNTYNYTIQNQSIESAIFSGQADPKHTFAMENYFSWNGFSLNVMMVYYGGHKMRVQQVHPMNTYYGLPLRPLASYYVDAWTPENTNTVVPGIGEYATLSASSSAIANNTDIFVQPADFLKIRNIVFGYDFSRQFISKIGLSSLGLRFQIDNPSPLWTKNKVGVDPETLGYRRLTSYIFGLNFRF